MMKINHFLVKGLAALVWVIASGIFLLEKSWYVGKKQQALLEEKKRVTAEDGQEFTV